MSVTELVGAAYDQMAKPAQQGAAELAAALFHQADGFMPVGVGQQNARVEQGNAVESLFAAPAAQGVEASAIEAPQQGLPGQQPELERTGRE